LAPGEPAIYSCVNIKHADNVAAAFNEAGFKAVSINGNFHESEVKEIISRFAIRDIQILTFCDLISEGTDIPAVSVVGMLRRTMSLSLYLQIVGRGLRPMQGKDRCLILDHVGNQKLHGHPLMTREWTLEGMQKRKRKDTDEQIDNEYKDCTECFRTYEKTHVACPYCGFVEPLKVSEIEQVAGVAVKDETTLDELLKTNYDEKLKKIIDKMVNTYISYKNGFTSIQVREIYINSLKGTILLNEVDLKIERNDRILKNLSNYMDFKTKVVSINNKKTKLYFFDELLKVKRTEQAKSRTLEDLWQLKIQRGHKDKWVYFVFESRVLKETNSIEYINNKHGLNAINRDDLKAAVLRKWYEFYKTKKNY
jgi:type I site-specific restriction endonuclease